jgi:hypothetical protein
MNFICENREYVVRYIYRGKPVVKSHMWVEPEDSPRAAIGDVKFVHVNGHKRKATVVGVV